MINHLVPCISRMTFEVIEGQHDILRDVIFHQTNHLNEILRFINGT